jgi:general nucleoside transport system ATP-binding protein
VIVRLSQICKRFGHVLANDDVSLEIRGGEVLALLGENGAGKSTLMKVLYGAERAEQGVIEVDGVQRAIASPREARALGIGMVFQQGSAIAQLSVAENLLLGAAGVRRFRPLARRNNPALDRALGQLRELAPEIDPTASVESLSAGERQLLELAKLLWRGARLLILDEPTSLLARPDAERLWRHVRDLAQRGHAVVMITHKLEDVASAADRVVVMRAGKIVHDTRDVAARDALLSAMGSKPAAPINSAAPPSAARAARLSVENVSASSGSARIEAVSFEVAAGEILGVAGVTGNGQELLARVLAGVSAAASGRIQLDQQALTPAARALRRSIAYIPDQPRVQACAPELSLLINLRALEIERWPWRLDLSSERTTARKQLARFDVRPPELERAAGTLSGGNLQKLVVARELSGSPALVVACFPTFGLDAAAARALQRELIAQAARGAAVVWISEELDPLLEHADRIAVLHRGRLHGPIPRAAASTSTLGAMMTGAAA